MRKRLRIGFLAAMIGLTFDASTRFDKLFSGVACELPCWVNPEDNRGKEHLTPEDTFDGDYGRLLERAYDGKGLASPTGRELNFTLPALNEVVGWLQRLATLRNKGGLMAA